MRTSWQAETGPLMCRWSEIGIRYNPQWMRETSESNDPNVFAPPANFAEHSPFGSGEWYAPWNVRWSVPAGQSPH
jgi:hypothetical protein